MKNLGQTWMQSQQQMKRTVTATSILVFRWYRTILASMLVFVIRFTVSCCNCSAFVPLIDGGKDIPKLYDGYFNSQIAKQLATAVSRATSNNIKKLEINIPPVPNLDEVRFGTPLNRKFGINIISKELNIPGGYVPGSDLSRQQVAFANMYWAKIVSANVGWKKQVTVLSSEPVTYNQIRSKGDISRIGPLQPSMSSRFTEGNAVDACYIIINPGAEETWERLRASYKCNTSKSGPFIVLNNAYSTTYGLGNKAGYEEVYYLKRISKGWIYRTYPGPWMAYLEKPDLTLELLQTYTNKPQLNEVAKLVRDESFRRFAINNDRWSKGFGERL